MFFYGFFYGNLGLENRGGEGCQFSTESVSLKRGAGYWRIGALPHQALTAKGERTRTKSSDASGDKTTVRLEYRSTTARRPVPAIIPWILNDTSTLTSSGKEFPGTDLIRCPAISFIHLNSTNWSFGAEHTGHASGHTPSDT